MPVGTSNDLRRMRLAGIAVMKSGSGTQTMPAMRMRRFKPSKRPPGPVEPKLAASAWAHRKFHSGRKVCPPRQYFMKLSQPDVTGSSPVGGTRNLPS